CLTLAKWETVSGQFGGYLRQNWNTPSEILIAVHAAQDGARYERQPSRLEMKKLLLTGIAVLLAISAAYAADEELPPEAPPPPPSIRVTPLPAPPLGWVYGPYTMCGAPPRCSTGVVNVPADGLTFA